MMNNYQVLYRDSVEYAYLVLFYKDLVNSPRTTPQTLYAFTDKSNDTVISSNDTVISKGPGPMVVKNIHGSEVYKRYIDRGWQDITKMDDSLPVSIKIWLSQQVESRNKTI